MARGAPPPPALRHLLVSVRPRHAESFGGFRLEIDLDHDDRLVRERPAGRARLCGDAPRGDEFELAPVGVLDVNPALDDEADVCVHAEVGLDVRLHVGGPPEAGFVNQALDGGVAGTSHFEHHAPDLAPLGAVDRRQDVVRHRRLRPERYHGLSIPAWFTPWNSTGRVVATWLPFSPSPDLVFWRGATNPAGH